MQKNSNAAIFAIRPEYAKSILDGTKKYEYRKVACKKPIEKMLIYATAPIMQVVGEADIREVLVDDPEEIWNRTNEFSGITKDFFDTYYKGRNKAVAYKVENVEKYIRPKTLEDFGVSYTPQSFVYL